ncbi:uncharacterized protein LOC118434410 [Folsomia candida]|uniref:uncharacterized protein LOC118434410 n=1 Tax=Folsomia candida TaxID=158441 RepID=UPI001604AF1F|nr:uncharacterized protein LOC118434410 [Folsomia candida]
MEMRHHLHASNGFNGHSIVISWRQLAIAGFIWTALVIYLTLGRILTDEWRQFQNEDRCQCQCQIHLNPPFIGVHNSGYSSNQITVSSFPSIMKHSQKDDVQLPPLSPEQMLSGEIHLDQDDPRLLNHICNAVLHPPPLRYDPRNVVLSEKNPHKKPAVQQQIYRYVINILKNMTSGFFVESGANDGELYSNTLALEMIHNWTGLLVEPDVKPIRKLLQRKRNAWIAPVCLSTQSVPGKTELLRSENNDLLTLMSKLTVSKKKTSKPWRGERFSVDCYPLFSLLASLNVTTVDYISLDVEGAELSILKTIPWKKLLIKVLSIEVPLGHSVNGEIHAYMSMTAGYRLVHYVQNDYSHDNIYVHPSVVI